MHFTLLILFVLVLKINTMCLSIIIFVLLHCLVTNSPIKGTLSLIRMKPRPILSFVKISWHVSLKLYHLFTDSFHTFLLEFSNQTEYDQKKSPKNTWVYDSAIDIAADQSSFEVLLRDDNSLILIAPNVVEKKKWIDTFINASKNMPPAPLLPRSSSPAVSDIDETPLSTTTTTVNQQFSSPAVSLLPISSLLPPHVSQDTSLRVSNRKRKANPRYNS